MKKLIIYTIIILAAFSAGILVSSNSPEKAVTDSVRHHNSSEPEKTIWTCSMHPHIRLSAPGKCPVCGMDLIPAPDEENVDGSITELKLSPSAVKLAEIRTSEVMRKFVPVEIRLAGKVAYDETVVKNITAWIPGRLDRLFVDYTGIKVNRGDHLVSMYSPDLLTAQEELIQATKSIKKSENSNLKILRETALKVLEATREKLRLWGITAQQIEEIEKRGKSTDHITIYSPISGIVIEKNVEEGTYVNTGTILYTVADMSRLWVMLNAYESDLAWLRYGQEAEIKTEAYPGEIFVGRISFIDPVLDSKSRTVKIRVNLDNTRGMLKPGMLVSSIIHSHVTAAGKVMDAALSGKWICPMHPEVIKDKKGKCDTCEMDLVTAESLGYVPVDDITGKTAPVVIPASAPLITGKRAIVYVADPDKKGTFYGREITLGSRAGDSYIVKSGLSEGERVVTYGNFKIDSALQILAKPSMMSVSEKDGDRKYKTRKNSAMNDETVKTHHDHGQDMIDSPAGFRDQVDSLLTEYFKIQEALTKDDGKTAKEKGLLFKKALDNADMTLPEGTGPGEWIKGLKELKGHADIISSTSDIEKQRISFEPVSESLKSIIKKFGTGGKHTVIVFHCPMAFNNKGADWLQDNPDLRNPYFGNMMLTCGEKRETLVEKAR